MHSFYIVLYRWVAKSKALSDLSQEADKKNWVLEPGIQTGCKKITCPSKKQRILHSLL